MGAPGQAQTEGDSQDSDPQRCGSAGARQRSRKQFNRLSDDNVVLLEVLKNPERIRGVDWHFRENKLFDE